ncbi:18137_t:CDS:1, partial [Cetraspora pellucida]
RRNTPSSSSENNSNQENDSNQESDSNQENDLNQENFFQLRSRSIIHHYSINKENISLIKTNKTVKCKAKVIKQL